MTNVAVANKDTLSALKTVGGLEVTTAQKAGSLWRMNIPLQPAMITHQDLHEKLKGVGQICAQCETSNLSTLCVPCLRWFEDEQGQVYSGRKPVITAKMKSVVVHLS